MSAAHDKLARILITSPKVILNLEEKMSAITGKKGVMEKIYEGNNILIERVLGELGMPGREHEAVHVYNALVAKLKHLDEHLYNLLGQPDLSKMSAVCGKLCETALKLNSPSKGYFIKKEKAAELLEKFPPNNLLEHFSCKTAGELISKEDFSSVFSALRFAQSADWMHQFFDKAYDDLKAGDFEEREVELKVLEPKWLEVAEKFLDKKYHNVSHLKEFGVIFVIPLKIDTDGETLRLFTLILHYLNEVPFYSKLFRKFSTEADFSVKLKSLLRGDVPEEKTDDPLGNWRIVQRYLAKDDPKDFRLTEPHINPEAEHWYKAEGDLAKLSHEGGHEGHSFGYWRGLDFVGDFFRDGLGNDEGPEELVSFDLIDLVMSLVKKGEIKYLYHQQEALWNKIFIEYFGREKMEELIEENIINGFIKLG